MDPFDFRHATSRKLAEAADENFVAHAGWLQRRHPEMRVIDRDDLVLIDSGLRCDTFNVVCRARLDRAHAARRAGEAIEHFRSARRPFSWWVGPADRPADLGRILAEAGLVPAETEVAMTADLGVVAFDSPAGAPRGLAIARVASAPELQVFARLSAANWTPPDPMVLRFYELGSPEFIAEDCPMWFYVGYWEGEPAATAQLTVGGGVAGLYNISTAAAYRRRGIGAAMVRHALFDARERGLRAAVLQAAPQGTGVYERVGFTAFGKVAEYKPLMA